MVVDMVWEGKLEKIDSNRWKIPADYMRGMKTDAIIYADDSMIDSIRSDNSPQQVANVACIPGIVGQSIAMPDIHFGYGFPIGGIAAVDAESGSISPGGIGFDINCGVRLIKTDLMLNDINGKLRPLIDDLYKNVPSGLCSKGLTRIDKKDMLEILMNGSEWAVENGFGWEKDLDVTEERGKMTSADEKFVSEKAKKRGLLQLGSLGSGNHFLEVDVVDTIFDENVAKSFGLRKGQITITVHCGSRGCGHQIATDFVQRMERYISDNKLEIPDRQLACAPLNSSLGEEYFKAMSCGANYAWANRQMITHWIRESFENVMNDSAENMGIDVLYDVAHNIAKLERHTVDGKNIDVLVHRKGATRAFCAGRPEITQMYRDVGQPVIIPGDMLTGTYVLVGKKGAMNQTFGSSCHGAGRQMSRKFAMSSINVKNVKENIETSNVYLRNGSDEGLVEEAPQTYKNVDHVISIVCNAGLAEKVARLKPVGVVKG